ncbi:hypothetical protein AMECASPLE_033903 [Ameca splendens]|uniref:Uncharacterized protein n=1 Tax=Ameca splendens TaxID=208324 RepID=A0ABV0Y6Y4_9TELE
MCAQSLCSTMARPVQRGTCPVKWSWPLCCSSVSGCLQSSCSLGHLYMKQQFIFSDPQKVLHHVECLVTSMRKCENNNIKINTPALHSHLRSCKTNESHDTGEEKWLIGHNLAIFTLGNTYC